MQRLEVSGAVRPIYGSLGVKRLIDILVSLKVHLPAALFICVCSVATSTHEIALHV
jgi:hypothetical protein